jgi:hypothetical protein
MPHMVKAMALLPLSRPDRLDRRRLLRYDKPREIGKPKEGTVAIDLSGGSSQMDYAEHGRMYGQFLLFTKIAIVFLVLILAGMGYFLT